MANKNTKPGTNTDQPDSSHPKSSYDGIGTTLAHRLLPASADPLIRLLRLDRPIGTWLLAWPALWGLAAAFRSDLTILDSGVLILSPLVIFPLFLLGAFLTRSAGCVFNDIADRKIDAQVARTRTRPLAEGSISVAAAFVILTVLLSLALIILLQFNWLTIGLGVFILAPILIYPFMKRITYWPQAMLSLCFSWGALMGWTAVTGSITPPAILITLAAFAWTMGFDTIYAHQDKEDDALLGMGSTALKFGRATKAWLWLFYGAALILLFAAGWLIGASIIFATAIALAALHASWQITTLDTSDPANCLKRFRANGAFGLIIFFGFILDLAAAYLISAT